MFDFSGNFYGDRYGGDDELRLAYSHTAVVAEFESLYEAAGTVFLIIIRDRRMPADPY